MRTLTTTLTLVALTIAMPLSVTADTDAINYGDNSSAFANDDQCDDPRFTGPGTAPNLDWTSAGADADDCRASVANGGRYWFDATSILIPDCSAVDFGENNSVWADDGSCDDPRFFNPAKLESSILMQDDLKQDAADCLKTCKSGQLYVRPTE